MRVKHDIHLGYEVGTGKPVEIPLRHMAVTGQTQESGKTTTLEALVSRADISALAFVTKRGEGSFAAGKRVTPYFRDRADWQFVSSIIDATLAEKNKFLRPWIIKTCRTTKTLADVHREVKKALEKARGINEGVYTQLDAYLEMIVPEIARAHLAKSLDLSQGLNVMDVSGFATPMQMLFVQSAIDNVNEHRHNTIVIVPEAWEFIPQAKASPVKNSATDLVRKGAGLGNYIWVDSQDMAGVDKVILRGCPVWLIGVQRESNEIKRNLANIPANIKKPRADEIAGLDRGQFFACWKDRVIKTYVQPAWMKYADAQDIASGSKSIDNIKPAPAALPPRQPEKRMDQVDQNEADALIAENRRLAGVVLHLQNELAAARTKIVLPSPASGNGHVDEDALFERLKSRLLAEPAFLRITQQRPELEIKVDRPVITADGKSAEGWIGRLILKGFFDQGVTGNAVFVELQRLGASLAKPSAYAWCDKMQALGFLTKGADKNYVKVEGMKTSIKEAATK